MLIQGNRDNKGRGRAILTTGIVHRADETDAGHEQAAQLQDESTRSPEYYP